MDSTPLYRRLTDAFMGNPFANAMVVIALMIGFFHGWLKLHFRSPVTTFAFDIPLILALLAVLPRIRSLSDFFPPGRASRVLMVFYGVVAVWFILAMVLPWGAPFLAALAALRGWCFSTLMFGLGYTIIVSRRQLHSYFVITIILGAITGYYATKQTEEEVLALQALDPYFEMMTRGTGFVSDEGAWVLRRFSTFISSGAFGGTMAATLSFAAALLSDPRIRKPEKTIIMFLSLFMGWGLFLSGARSAMVAMVIGLAVTVFFRRLPPALMVLLAICGLALFLGQQLTGGATLDRIQTLDTGSFFGRFWIVLVPGWNYLMQSAMLGGGLGKGMVGMPQFMIPIVGRYDVWGVDGDLGKAMSEFGIVGTSILVWLLAAGLMDGLSIMRRNRNTYAGTMGIGAFGLFANAVIGFPTGSPFIGIPMGVLTWFFLGAAIRLDRLTVGGHEEGAEKAADRKNETAQTKDPVRPPSPFASPSPAAPPHPPKPSVPPAGTKHFMFADRLNRPPGQPRPADAPKSTPAPPLPSPKPRPTAPPIPTLPNPAPTRVRDPRKRFLY